MVSASMFAGAGAAAAAVWTSLFVISHSKVITVNNEGNSSTNCCVHGRCPCGSLSNTLQYLENHTIINITSQSVPLHGLNRILYLNNITIFGNGATVMCNNSGIVYILYCRNVVIQGIIWDQCGDTDQPDSAGIGFRDISNLAILSSTFQHSGACIAVFLSIKSGYVEVKNSNFLSNHVVNPSRCQWYSSLFSIVENEFYRMDNFTITDTIFHYNGDFNSTTHPNNSMLYVYFWQYHQINIYLKNSTISSSGGLGAFISCNAFTNKTIVDLHGVKIVNNSGGGSVLLLNGSPLNLLVNSSTFAYNSNGSLMVVNEALFSTVWLNEVSVFQNKGTFKITKQPFFPNFSNQHCFANGVTADEGVGVVLWLLSPFSEVVMSSCNIYNNIGEKRSIVYIDSYQAFQNTYSNITILSSNFTNNIGVCCMILSPSTINLAGNVLFENNSANSGAAFYLNELSTIMIGDGAVVEFIDNSALLQGGAIFVDLSVGCNQNHKVFKFLSDNAIVSFIDTVGGFYWGNAIYFSVSASCNLNLNYSESNSIMYVPYQFNYSRFINDTLVNIPINYNYTEYDVSHFPVVTSPHQLKLFGDHVKFVNNVYFIGGKVLNKAVIFNGIVLDYFGKPTDTTEFLLKCTDCSHVYTLLNSALEVDNVSPLHVIIVGEEINGSANVTLIVQSHYYLQIVVTLVIEFVPCPDHPGFSYSTTSKGCVCYHHDVVECNDDYNEIKRGYWFGRVNGKATTSLCPNRYCRFINRKMTRQGYFELPDRINGQCNHHRSSYSHACGECSPRYTLAYDSTDCISVDHCSTGMTVLVIVLTCLYWIVVVVGVFGLMYLNFQLQSGYLYGIIYYYSMLSILLNNNPYISTWGILFINILSGFAQLTPNFLGQLCLVKGLSGIDQLFIHYSHAIAFSLLLLSFVLLAKYSRRVAEFISRCSIRVFCFLLLLAYTSLASTSLQLLRPLKFTDVNDVYTYASPNVEYFHGRHLIYGTVALFCELIIGIGLPLLLVMEPFLKRKITFIRFKPILDQFQGCYKDKYRWFAGYYLICRQVIMLIVFIWNNNYYNMLFYLQTTCIIIATIHLLFQPYKNTLLNIFDGIILQVMIVVVNISTFDFLQSATTEVVLLLAVLPLTMLCIAGIVKKVMHSRRHKYVAITGQSDDDDDGNNVRNDIDPYNQIQEPLFDIAAEIDN